MVQLHIPHIPVLLSGQECGIYSSVAKDNGLTVPHCEHLGHIKVAKTDTVIFSLSQIAIIYIFYPYKFKISKYKQELNMIEHTVP